MTLSLFLSISFVDSFAFTLSSSLPPCTSFRSLFPFFVVLSLFLFSRPFLFPFLIQFLFLILFRVFFLSPSVSFPLFLFFFLSPFIFSPPPSTLLSILSLSPALSLFLPPFPFPSLSLSISFLVSFFFSFYVFPYLFLFCFSGVSLLFCIFTIASPLLGPHHSFETETYSPSSIYVILLSLCAPFSPLISCRPTPRRPRPSNASKMQPVSFPNSNDSSGPCKLRIRFALLILTQSVLLLTFFSLFFPVMRSIPLPPCILSCFFSFYLLLPPLPPPLPLLRLLLRPFILIFSFLYYIDVIFTSFHRPRGIHWRLRENLFGKVRGYPPFSPSLSPFCSFVALFILFPFPNIIVPISFHSN